MRAAGALELIRFRGIVRAQQALGPPISRHVLLVPGLEQLDIPHYCFPPSSCSHDIKTQSCCEACHRHSP
jgi:hypothetical protein